MPKRCFTCHCHSKMRFGAKHCSYCFRDTPLYNRWGFYLTIGVAVGVAGVFTAIT